MNDFSVFLQGSRHAMSQSRLSVDIFFLLLGVTLTLVAVYFLRRQSQASQAEKREPFAPVRMRSVSHAMMRQTGFTKDELELWRKRLGNLQIRNVLPLFQTSGTGVWSYILDHEVLPENEFQRLKAMREELHHVLLDAEEEGLNSQGEASFEAVPQVPPTGVTREEFFPWKGLGHLYVVRRDLLVLEVHGMPATDWQQPMTWTLIHNHQRFAVQLQKIMRTSRSWFLFLELPKKSRPEESSA